jgi:hypothetical protein
MTREDASNAIDENDLQSEKYDDPITARNLDRFYSFEYEGDNLFGSIIVVWAFVNAAVSPISREKIITNNCSFGNVNASFVCERRNERFQRPNIHNIKGQRKRRRHAEAEGVFKRGDRRPQDEHKSVQYLASFAGSQRRDLDGHVVVAINLRADCGVALSGGIIEFEAPRVIARDAPEVAIEAG